jgi:hypothetical protein
MDPTRRTTHRTSTLPIAAGVALALLLAAAWTLTRGSADPTASSPPPQPAPPAAPTTTLPATTTTLDPEAEVVARLRQILRVRDQAYRQRDPDLLATVYTSDCPCLAGDGNAIKQLLKDDARWVGASTSIRVDKLQRVNDRLWVVVAFFDASAFRIETASGQLVRSIQAKSELFRFVLAKTATGSEWLLGYAAPVKG